MRQYFVEISVRVGVTWPSGPNPGDDAKVYALEWQKQIRKKLRSAMKHGVVNVSSYFDKGSG
jgi:hypothetical protein